MGIKRAYYNENDPDAAAWLRQLIINGDIADGEVDERSIIEVKADDLKGFTQHHFFAGIGTWSHSLRNAGWSDDRQVCTASLPCQPFSVAGNQKGNEDERHLLPHFTKLVKQCGFNVIFGEQVEGAIRHGWLDDLQATMEAEGYAVGHAVLGAHSVNAAHQRQRLYWVANSIGQRQERVSWEGEKGAAEYSQDSRLAYSENGNRRPEPQLTSGISRETRNKFGGVCSDSRVGNTERDGLTTDPIRRSISKSEAESGMLQSERPSTDIEWLYCRDNKYRPIKSGVKPLVNGVARGVVYSGGSINANNTGLAKNIRLKGYGNAIQAKTAQLFIESFMELKA
jgi:DNA (cytosine-5)-methyltransferase 1